MAERIRFGAVFRMDEPEQARAWAILSAVPPRQRMAALAHMVCGYRDQRRMLDAIRTLLREELAPQQNAHLPQDKAECIDSDVLGFLSALQQGDDLF